MSAAGARGPDNWLGAEPILVGRLKTVLGTAVHVLTARELAAVQEAGQPTPAVHVLYHRDEAVQSTGAAGEVCEVAQVWLAVCCVTNDAGLKAGSAAGQDAGILGVRVRRALIGPQWRPGAGLAPFVQVASPFAFSYSGGRFYLPLAFRTKFVMRS